MGRAMPLGAVYAQTFHKAKAAMAGRRARATKDEIKRALCVARELGAAGVGIRPDGEIVVRIAHNPGQDSSAAPSPAPPADEEVIL